MKSPREALFRACHFRRSSAGSQPLNDMLQDCVYSVGMSEREKEEKKKLSNPSEDFLFDEKCI